MTRRTVAKDGPHPIDVLVGRRARERRTLEGMSQSAVAETLGLSFQQLRKYEKGGNRISASRLYELAELLGVPVSYFFEGVEEGKSAPPQDEMLTKRETLELVRAYYKITDPEMRDSVRKLTQAMANLEQSPATGRRRASPAPAIEFDRSKIDGRTKVGKVALAALKKRGRKSKADLEALAAVDYPGAAAKLADR